MVAGRCVKRSSHTTITIMATTTQKSLILLILACAYPVYKITTASEDPNDESYELRVRWNGVKSWFRGTTALSRVQEARGHNMLKAYNATESGDSIAPEDGELLSEVKDEEGKVTRRRVRRRMHMPFVHRLVRHCRGELGQREHTPSNVMVVERVARAYCHENLIRSHDISCLLPGAVALYFFSRSDIQIETAALCQSTAFVNSTKPRWFSGVGGRQSARADD